MILSILLVHDLPCEEEEEVRASRLREKKNEASYSRVCYVSKEGREEEIGGMRRLENLCSCKRKNQCGA